MFKVSTGAVALFAIGLVGLACNDTGLRLRADGSGDGGAASEGQAGASGGSGTGVGGTGGNATIAPGGAGAMGGRTASTDPGTAGLGGGGSGGVLAPVNPNCGNTTITLAQQQADLLLVLDRSGSMNDDIASDSPCGGGGAPANCTTRWSTMTTALSQLLTASPAGVNWGLKFFTSPGGQVCTVNPGVDVPVPATAAEIQAAIAGTTPGGEAPTAAAINAAVDYFNALNDSRSHYILLATDGQPNCDPGTSTAVGPTSVVDTANAIAAAYKLGVKTYVVGIGPSIGNLDSFAQAGGASTDFLSPADLTSAFSTVADSLASCVFRLSHAPPDPRNVVVDFNGDASLRAPRDTTQTNGWDYTSSASTAIQLYGSYCDNVFNGTYKTVEILMGCPSPGR